ncbi:hypothetical protein CMQ_7328 [Grosmannia clavigera kw1407]|uniref:Uncharacterized protein n=1 Tax=Grosmannia clavigera (strain kw1407 / UAMH 11150) TaxID=655863 RepID=F0XQJ3_GROCL|nr:uncharacterized protein CMQ_7328 [Grosmannia clavigera kw1407]EFX00326.1 hypothetical protein CMQ_7328 [Grosmannia clavigera kw1407]
MADRLVRGLDRSYGSHRLDGLHRLALLSLDADDPLEVAARPQMANLAAVQFPAGDVGRGGAAGVQQGGDLVGRAGAQHGHPAVEDEHKRQDGQQVGEDERHGRAPAPGVVGCRQQDAEPEGERGEEGGDGAVLELEDAGKRAAEQHRPTTGSRLLVPEGGTERPSQSSSGMNILPIHRSDL